MSNKNHVRIRWVLSIGWFAKNFRIVLAVFASTAIVLVLLLGNGAKSPVQQVQQSCQSYRADKVLSIGSQKITAEVADTLSEREKGLSGRTCISGNEGMLFVFEKPGRYQFWMKDMKFPLDIVWIGADHQVVTVETNISPKTYPHQFVNKDKPALYVLEIQANRSKSLNINLGTPINF